MLCCHPLRFPTTDFRLLLHQFGHFIIQCQPFTDVAIQTTFYDAMVAAKGNREIPSLCVLIYIVFFRIGKPKIECYGAFVLKMVLCAVTDTLQQVSRFLLERVKSLDNILALIKEVFEHDSNRIGLSLCKVLNHPFREASL